MSKSTPKKMAAAAASQVEIPASVIREVADSIKKASDTIAPYSSTLNPEERKRMLRANNKTVDFLKKALEYSLLNPNYLSGIYQPSELQATFANMNQLLALQTAAAQLDLLLRTTKMVNGGGAYEVALAFYNTVKVAAKRNVPGAEVMYKELSARFPGRKKKKPLSQDIQAATDGTTTEMKAA